MDDGGSQRLSVGDVHVWPTPIRRSVSLCLTSSESATVELNVAEVRQFLAATAVVVPYGAEVVDVDAIVARIVGSVAS